MKLRGLAVLWLTAAAALTLAAPRILIVQLPVPPKDADDINRPIANYIASEFDQNRLLASVVFGMSDPAFREAAMAGKLPNVPDTPNRGKALEYAPILGAEYVAITTCYVENNKVVGTLDLVKGGKSIYQDNQNVVIGGGLSSVDAARSLARTLVVRMSAEVLKKADAGPNLEPPKPDEGQAPVVVAVTPPPAKPNSAEVIKTANQMLAADQRAQAVEYLRDAVDIDPLNVDLRIALIGALSYLDPSLAGAEAHNASVLMPEAAELHALAARAWLRAGQPDNAQLELNAALARDPDAVSTRTLMGEIAIAQLKPDKALEHLDFVIAKQDSPDARYLRSLAYAISGRPTEMKADWGKAEGSSPARYDFSMEVLDRGLQTDANTIRSFLQRVVVKPDDKELLDLVSTMQHSYQARAEFCEGFAAPEPFKAAHDQRLLAFRLIVQTLSDIQSYMGGGGDEALSDARIDLSEALKNASESKVAETQARQKP